jgi:hypothetical protein
MEGLSSGGRRPVVESLMRPLVVVMVDPAGDGIAGFGERLVFVKPDFFLLEGAVKAFLRFAYAVRIRAAQSANRIVTIGNARSMMLTPFKEAL